MAASSIDADEEVWATSRASVERLLERDADQWVAVDCLSCICARATGESMPAVQLSLNSNLELLRGLESCSALEIRTSTGEQPHVRLPRTLCLLEVERRTVQLLQGMHCAWVEPVYLSDCDTILFGRELLLREL